MMAHDKNQRPSNEDGKATRRGFLLGLLAGLAGAAGLGAAKFGAALPGEAAPRGGSGSGSGAGKPIDNIFVPIRSSKRKAQKGGL